MGCARHCATLSGLRAVIVRLREKNSTSAAPSTSYLWSECANFRTLSHLSPLMSFPCHVTLLVCARQAPSRRPPPQLMVRDLGFRSVISSGSSGPICFIMVGVDQPRGVQKFGQQCMHAHASVYGGVDFTRFFPCQGGPRIPRWKPGAFHTWKSGHFFHGPVCLVFMCCYSGSCRRKCARGWVSRCVQS